MGDRLTPPGCLSILHLHLNEIDRGTSARCRETGYHVVTNYSACCGIVGESVASSLPSTVHQSARGT